MTRSKGKKKEKAKKKEKEEEDKISELGDDILISIISRLTLKEATATSVLSTRWRPLHTQITRLNFFQYKHPLATLTSQFDILKFISTKGEEKYKRILDAEEKKIVKMINHTLDSYKGGQSLKEFKIHMFGLKDAVNMNMYMKRWLEFALARGVEIIDITLRRHFMYLSGGVNYHLQLDNLEGLKCLRKLHLCEIGVDDQVIKLILSHSLNLETLSLEDHRMLHFPRALRNVMIVGHPKLQYLNICSHQVESINIENLINLISLRLYELTPTCVVHVNNAPKLIEFNYSETQGFTPFGGRVGAQLSPCILSQLLFVRITLWSLSFPQDDWLPELINVKHLVVEWHYKKLHWHVPVYPLIKLIEACRSLEKFEMKLKHPNEIELPNSYPRQNFEYSVVKKCSPNLRKVKLLGYLGSPTEWEVSAFIIKYAAASLQELTVKPCHASYKCYQRLATAKGKEKKQLGPKIATSFKSCLPIAAANVRKQLEPIIPNSTKLLFV